MLVVRIPAMTNVSGLKVISIEGNDTSCAGRCIYCRVSRIELLFLRRIGYSVSTKMWTLRWLCSIHVDASMEYSGYRNCKNEDSFRDIPMLVTIDGPAEYECSVTSIVQCKMFITEVESVKGAEELRQQLIAVQISFT